METKNSTIFRPLSLPFFESEDALSKEEEPDHRNDGIYDELDDIDAWAANEAKSSNADLSKRIHQGLDRISAGKSVALHERAENRRRENQTKDKLDRATVEQVLDPRTRMILFRLLSRGRLRTLDGCVSTGKEANVYYGTAAANSSGSLVSRTNLIPRVGLLPEDRSPDAPVAVKVFKTSILQFKDRERYVAGEFRFRRGGYNRSSSRKMIQQWAEKEYRNLIRLQEANIPCPVPLLLKSPILVMSFFGRDGWPAPLLKDSSLSGKRLEKAYFRVCVLMRRMYHEAKLVHADLSEYNILFWNGEVIIIDVSQSVEHDHPMALDFLRSDCSNINTYFQRNGVPVILGLRQLFDYVTNVNTGTTEAECSNELRKVLEQASMAEEQTASKTAQDDRVFKQSYIPRSLLDVPVPSEPLNSDATSHAEPESVLHDKLSVLSLSETAGKKVVSTEDPKVPDSKNIKGEEKIEKIGSSEPAQVKDDELENVLESSDGNNVVDGDSDKNDQEQKLGIPNIEFEEDTFDECNEPIATKLLSMTTKSSKSSSGRTSPSHTPTQQKKKDPNNEERDSAAPLFDDMKSAQCMENGPDRIDSKESEGAEVNEDRPMRCTENSNEADTKKEDSSMNSEYGEDENSTFVLNHEGQLSERDDGHNNEGNTLHEMTRKEWKKHVKAEARERRENKIPKHVKKRKELLAKRRRSKK